MPTAGDEGYEKLVICPYDKAHEIRRGRMQFHLDKCRKNFPNAELAECPFNSSHIIPKVEMNYHTEEECSSRVNWDRYTHEIGDTVCPVKDLVPVNAGTLPDGDENWDNFEAPGSVLNHIRAEAETRDIIRMKQCAPRSERKAFREQEKLRHLALKDAKSNPPVSDSESDRYSVVSNTEPLPRPKKLPNIPIRKQNPADAMAQLNKQFTRTLDLNQGPSTSKDAYSKYETASVAGSTFSSSQEPSLSYASASSRSNPWQSRPPSAMNYAQSMSSVNDTSVSMMTALSSHPSAAMLTAMSSRPSTAMSTAMSCGGSSRPLSAMSLHTSMTQASLMADEDGFCQIPIPGLGRAKRRMKR